MRSSKASLANILLALALGMTHAHAEAPTTQAALARAQGMLKQLNEAKQQLEIENAKLKASNAGLEQLIRHAKLETAERESDLASRSKERDSAKQSLVRVEKRNEQITARLEEVVAKYKESARTLQQTATDNEQLQRDLASVRGELANATSKNLALYQSSRTIMAKFKHKPRWTTLLQAEPFTGIKQVEIEDAVENYDRDMSEQLLDANIDAAQAGGETRE